MGLFVIFVDNFKMSGITAIFDKFWNEWW